jgi:hypothetical protein
MKMFFLCLVMVLIGVFVSSIFYDLREDDRIMRERTKAQDVVYNLSYEKYAHEQDVDLLKHEIQTLQLSCP